MDLTSCPDTDMISLDGGPTTPLHLHLVDYFCISEQLIEYYENMQPSQCLCNLTPFTWVVCSYAAADSLQGTELEGIGERIGEWWACKWLQSNNDNGSDGKGTISSQVLSLSLSLSRSVCDLISLSLLDFISSLNVHSVFSQRRYCTYCNTCVHQFMLGSDLIHTTVEEASPAWCVFVLNYLWSRYSRMYIFMTTCFHLICSDAKLSWESEAPVSLRLEFWCHLVSLPDTLVTQYAIFSFPRDEARCFFKPLGVALSHLRSLCRQKRDKKNSFFCMYIN